MADLRSHTPQIANRIDELLLQKSAPQSEQDDQKRIVPFSARLRSKPIKDGKTPKLGDHWTPHHSTSLMKAVQDYGFKWTMIQQDPLFTDFSIDTLFYRYWRCANNSTPEAPTPPKKRWTPELDALLLKRLSVIWAFTPRP
ncbi:UNVERIFIED_CONTAM: hypothetical protein HDU68_006340, partial [Siphonaria sp. JEL0065]